MTDFEKISCDDDSIIEDQSMCHILIVNVIIMLMLHIVSGDAASDDAASEDGEQNSIEGSVVDSIEQNLEDVHDDGIQQAAVRYLH